MGEEPRAGTPQLTDEGAREPHEIRRDIESTRGDLGDTVEALAEKADVKSQAQRKFEQVKQTVDAKRNEVLGKTGETAPEGARSAVSAVGQKARENPVAVAVAGAFAAGLIVGRITNR